jgi:Tol biopolymer transport system component
MLALGACFGVTEGKEPARKIWGDPDTNILGAPSPDGRYLSYVDGTTGDLALLDVAKGEKRRLTRNTSRGKSGEFAYFSIISPDNRLIAYAWFNDQKFYDLRTLALDGSSPRTLYRNEEAGFVQPCSWSPDGKEILTLFFRKDNISQIALVSAADGAVRVVKSLNWVYPKKMDFSPDGRFIVYDSFGRNGPPQRDIFVLSADGSREIPLVEHPADDLFPLWAPNGIFFASDRAGTMDLWMIPVSEGRPQGSPQLVRRDMGRFLPMKITRSGAYYYGLRSGATDVYVAEWNAVEGKLIGKPQLASPRFQGGNGAPEWSPDGQYLAYFSRRGSENYGQESRIIVIRSLATGQEREVSPKLAHLESLRWSPDSRFFLVSGSDRRSRAGVYRIDGQTGEVASIVQDDDATFRGLEGVWRGDGKGVFYVHESGGTEIRLRDVEGIAEKSLYRPDSASRVHHLALSPDGRWLAFVLTPLERAQTEALLVVPSAGGSPRELFRIDGGGATGVGWTPDGLHLLVSWGEQGTAEVWRVPFERGQTQKLDLPANWHGSARLHPDGRRIAFAAGNTRAEVWVIENLTDKLQSSR